MRVARNPGHAAAMSATIQAEQGFGFNDIVFGLLTAAVTGLEGLLTLGVFVHG